MILYFSGTGNSEHAAKRIGQETADEVLNLFERLKNKDYSRIASSRPWVVVTPTYAWRIPRILEEWLKRTELAGSRDIYFVMTCGENIGNAGKYLRALCTQKGMCYRGCLAVVMPENYIAMFATPTREAARKIIEKAEKRITQAAAVIRSGKEFAEPDITITDRLISGIVNDLFYPVCVTQRNFMRRMPAYPAESVSGSVRHRTSGWRTAGRSGERSAPIVWPVSAAARRKRSNMENTAGGFPGIRFRNRRNERFGWKCLSRYVRIKTQGQVIPAPAFL